MNNLAVLTQRLATSLRDEEFELFGAAELTDLVTWAQASLWPRVGRELPYTTTTVPLVADTYIYSLPPAVMSVSEVDWVNGEDIEMGWVNGWTTVGDEIAGNLKLRVPPMTVAALGTLHLTAYGRYGSSRHLLAASADADDIVHTALAHSLSEGDQVRFTSLSGGGDLDTNIPYFVLADNLTSTTFQIATTRGGSAADFATDITAGVMLQDSLVPDEYVPLILAMGRAEAWRRAAGTRMNYTQWAARNQIQDISPNEIIQFVNEADVEVGRLRRGLRTWQRPVPGRRR
jgi:hypothetical protein